MQPNRATNPVVPTTSTPSSPEYPIKDTAYSLPTASSRFGGGSHLRSISRLLRVTLAVGALADALLSTGCSDSDTSALHRTLMGLGVEDAPAAPPRTFRLVCDRSETAPCEHGVMMQMISAAIHEAYQRPGSHVEVHLVGRVVAETRRVASVSIPARAVQEERVARAAEERFVQSIRPMLCAPLGAALASARPRRSPLAESLDKIALESSQGMPVEVIAVTDLREVSDLGDFECGRLPSEQDFLARLQRHGILGPRTFTNARVHFVVGDHGPVPRRNCPVTMGRERTVMQLWTTALRNAGASEVTFHTEVPDLATLFADAPDAGVARLTTTPTTTARRTR